VRKQEGDKPLRKGKGKKGGQGSPVTGLQPATNGKGGTVPQHQKGRPEPNRGLPKAIEGRKDPFPAKGRRDTPPAKGKENPTARPLPPPPAKGVMEE